MAGNRLGERSYYAYEGDSGADYVYLTDDSLGAAAGATQSTAGAFFPRRFSPRVVFCESVTSPKVRRELIIPSADSTLFASELSQNIMIDGEVFQTTGRRGEQFSFPVNSTQEPETP